MRHIPSAGQPAARRGRERRARSEPSGLLGSALSREPGARPASDGDVSDAEALSLLLHFLNPGSRKWTPASRGRSKSRQSRDRAWHGSCHKDAVVTPLVPASVRA
jgi:hypothetical protein